MKSATSLALSVGLLIVPAVVTAQPERVEGLRPEVSFSAGTGVVFPSVESETPILQNLGGSVRIRPWRRVGVEFEGNANLARLRSYGLVWTASVNSMRFLSSGRTQPYVSGGVGVLWSDKVDTSGTAARLAGNLALGAVYAVTESVSFRAEIRTYLTADLRLFRPSFGMGYHW